MWPGLSKRGPSNFRNGRADNPLVQNAMTGILCFAGILAAAVLFWAVQRRRESARAEARAQTLREIYKLLDADVCPRERER